MKFACCAIAIGVSCASIASAQTVTAMKSGEQTTGQTKQCFYSFAGNTYTRTVSALQFCPENIQVQEGPSRVEAVPFLATALKSGEEVTGNTKQCYYTYIGNTYTKTIPSYAVCPMSIQVQQ